jgi:hypothetical protein
VQKNFTTGGEYLCEEIFEIELDYSSYYGVKLSMCEEAQVLNTGYINVRQ